MGSTHYVLGDATCLLRMASRPPDHRNLADASTVVTVEPNSIRYIGCSMDSKMVVEFLGLDGVRVQEEPEKAPQSRCTQQGGTGERSAVSVQTPFR